MKKLISYSYYLIIKKKFEKKRLSIIYILYKLYKDWNSLNKNY